MALRFVVLVARYAGWLFVLLGILMAREALILLQAYRHRQSSLFGLEHEAATGLAQRSLISLLLYGTLLLGVHTIAFKIAPGLPVDPREPERPPPILSEPPRAELATDTPTPPPFSPTPPPLQIITSTPPAL